MALMCFDHLDRSSHPEREQKDAQEMDDDEHLDASHARKVPISGYSGTS